MARSRSGRWFDPSAVAAAAGIEDDLEAWRALDERKLSETVRDQEPGDGALLAGPGSLDRIALGFADVVDAKSPFTAAHSYRVSELSLKLAEKLGFTAPALADLRCAALLHDIGKLSVPNFILDKPTPLSAEEWDVMRLHPYYTLRVLLHIRGFKRIAHVAASHHERLDGRGYFRGLRGDQIPREAQILAAADIFDALTTARPYRPALPDDMALKMMEGERDAAVGGECLDALGEVLEQAAAADDDEGREAA
jgi:putative nucleotidyltransferase with HDIG domain